MGPEHDLEYHFEHGELSELSPKSRKKEPILSTYVTRYHALEKFIGDWSKGTMTRNKLKGTCFLTKFEPRTVKDALNNES